MQTYTSCLLMLYFTSLNIFTRQVKLYTQMKDSKLLISLLLNIFSIIMFIVGALFFSIWINLFLVQ